MKKLIIANWKMLPETLAQAQEILDFTNEYLESMAGRGEFTLVLCPPFVFIEEVSRVLKMSHFEDISFLGAQDIAHEDKAALTGEVSGPMLDKLGVRYVIIGHSERRWQLGEGDDIVNKKLKATLRNGMIPVVCIGERERDSDFKMFLEQQLKRTFEGISAEDLKRCIIAYEPVWAISTNPNSRPDTPASALESIRIIQRTLIDNWQLEADDLPKVLYGGSVNSKNVSEFLGENDIKGVLVGGASVRKDEFVKILGIASKL